MRLEISSPPPSKSPGEVTPAVPISTPMASPASVKSEFAQNACESPVSTSRSVAPTALQD